MSKSHTKTLGFESTQDSMLMLDNESWKSSQDQKRYIENFLHSERQLDLSEILMARLNEYDR